MPYKLLAKKYGDISIVEVIAEKKKYLVLRPAYKTRTHKVFLAEQGKTWELFINVDDATNWIMEGRPNEEG